MYSILECSHLNLRCIIYFLFYEAPHLSHILEIKLAYFAIVRVQKFCSVAVDGKVEKPGLKSDFSFPGK